jgi:hypothetical protein
MGDEHGHASTSEGSLESSSTEADPIEAALAEAVRLAAHAGQWTTVETLSRELSARRLAGTEPTVTSLDAARRKREV